MSVSDILLPDRFLVKGFKHCSSGPLVTVYMLLDAGRIFHPRPTTQMLVNVENPLTELQGGVWKDDGLELRQVTVQIKILNESSLRNIQMIRTKEIIELPSGIRYPVYTMNHMMDTLRPWSSVYRGWDTSNRWAFTKEELQQITQSITITPPITTTNDSPLSWTPRRRLSAPPQPTPTSQVIPKHILKIFIESAIAKGDTCPITLDPLTKESAACLPCGHLVDREALERAVQERKCCPVCRASGTVESIQGHVFGN